MELVPPNAEGRAEAPAQRQYFERMGCQPQEAAYTSGQGPPYDAVF